MAKKLLACSMLAFAALAAPQKAEAISFSLPVFPSVTPSCGTIDVVGATFPLPGLEDGCKVWRSDAGGVFTFAGIEDFDVGDRVFVSSGQQCNICLTVCPAVPLLNATLDECDGDPK